MELELVWLTHYRPTMPFGNKKKILLEDLLNTLLLQFEKYHSSKNQKFDNFGIFHSLKFCI